MAIVRFKVGTEKRGFDMRYLISLTLILLLGVPNHVAVSGDELLPLQTPKEPAERIPTIREIMQQAHRCRNNYIYQVSRDLNQPEVEWSNLEQRSRDLIQMGKYLQQNTPPRGAGPAWERITGVYISHATLLADAVERRDLLTAQEHTVKLKQLCAHCHSAHR